MTAKKVGTFLWRWAAKPPGFTPAGFVSRAALKVVLFLVCDLAGLRVYTSALTGTLAGDFTGALLGILYVIVYLEFYITAPVLIIGALFLFLFQRFGPRAPEEIAEDSAGTASQP